MITDDFAGAYRINPENAYKLNYWMGQLKLTNDELKKAVSAVGDRIESVKVYLNNV